jgi:hypothetical protein
MRAPTAAIFIIINSTTALNNGADFSTTVSNTNMPTGDVADSNTPFLEVLEHTRSVGICEIRLLAI